MTETADLTHPVNFGALLLETAAENHLVEHLAEKLLVGFLDRLDLRLATFLILRFRKLDHFEFDVSVFWSRCFKAVASGWLGLSLNFGFPARCCSGQG